MLDVEDARKTLEQIADVLESLEIKYWIASGTLLGAYRDGAINQYDHDIDIKCYPGSVNDKNISTLVKRMWEIGYTGIIGNGGKMAQLICGNNDKPMLDLKFCYSGKGMLWSYHWIEIKGTSEPVIHVYPLELFEELDEIELYGRKYPTPKPILKYIELHYGDEWQKFKTRIEDAGETDLTWDRMYSPPCSKSFSKFQELMNATV